MGIFISQNPGVGIFQLTTAEEAFLTSFANLTYSNGDVLTIVGGVPDWVPPSGGIPAGAAMWDIPYVNTAGTDFTTAQSLSDGLFRVQLLGAGEVMLDMFSANSVQSGVASFLIGDAGKVITFGTPSTGQA